MVAKGEATNQNRSNAAGQKEWLCWLHYLMVPPVLQGWGSWRQWEVSLEPHQHNVR